MEIGGGLEYKFQGMVKKKLDRDVDGFFNNTVYQFHGRFYYGCPNCFHT